MRPLQLIALSVAVSGIASPLHAQVSDPPTAIEITAAQHMLRRHPAAVVRIDPLFAVAGTAPGERGTESRPRDRNAILADTLAAVISPRRTAGSSFLAMSKPVIVGDTARISVTATYPVGPGGAIYSYETLALTLVRTRGGWRVTDEVQLGIS